MNAGWYALPLVLTGAALAPGALAVQSAGASASGGTSTARETVVALGAEAWYSSPKLCIASICLPIPSPFPQVYPAGTLHIGAAGGSESARSYLALRRPLPPSTSISGGTLRLPLDTSPLDGSLAPDLAKVEACTTTTPIKAVEAATTPPPPVDCQGAPVSHLIGTPAVELDIDLKPIAARLEKRGTSLALLPVLSLGATFDVTVSADTRPKGSATTPVLILDNATTDGAAAGSPPTPAPSNPAPSPSGTSAASDSGPAPSIAAPGLAPPPRASEAPGEAASEPVIAPRLVALPSRARGFDYPVVFLVPLLVLAALLVFGRQLTRPLTRPPSR